MSGGRYGCIPYFRRRNAARLWDYARRGLTAEVQQELDSGADVKEAAKDGIPALWAAAQGGHGPVVEALLKAGAARIRADGPDERSKGR